MLLVVVSSVLLRCRRWRTGVLLRLGHRCCGLPTPDHHRCCRGDLLSPTFFAAETCPFLTSFADIVIGIVEFDASCLVAQAISAPAQPPGPGGQRGPADQAGQQQGSLGCWADRGDGKQAASNRKGSVARGSSSCSLVDQVYLLHTFTALSGRPPRTRAHPPG